MSVRIRGRSILINANPVGYRLYSNNTAVGTDANTSQKNLMLYAMPSGTLVNSGDRLIITAYVKTAVNANLKTIKLFFGATEVATSGAILINNYRYSIRAEVMQISGAAQDTFSLTAGNGAGSDWLTTLVGATREQVAGETITNTISIIVTGQNGTASANDVVCEMMTVHLVPAQ